MRLNQTQVMLSLAVTVALVAAACGDDTALVPTGSEREVLDDQSPSGGPAMEVWGPLAIVATTATDEGLVAGILEISANCIVLDERGHQRLVLGWPLGPTSWISESSGIGFDRGPSASALILHDQDRLTLAGGFVAHQEDVEWALPPNQDCGGEGVWLVSDVTEVVAAADSLTASEEPIGGGLAAGTEVDLQLECPPDVARDETEWFGPAGLTLHGAVAEAFGDLIVGWIGEPFEIESTDDWSSWGLRDDAGNLVAVATVVASDGGWDPSHARYCVIPRPTPPPPPLTLYVSNQSFEDPTVGITITIDGQVVVDQDFDVEGQHNWITFTPDVGPGDHTLTAVSSTGAKLTVEFNISIGEPRWAVVDYWWYPDEGPRTFTFDISDEPIGFA